MSWTWRGTGFLCHKKDAYDSSLPWERTISRNLDEREKRYNTFKAKALIELDKLGNKGFDKEQCKSYLRGIFDDIMDGWEKSLSFTTPDELYERYFNNVYSDYISRKKAKLRTNAIYDKSRIHGEADRFFNTNKKAKEHRW